MSTSLFFSFLILSSPSSTPVLPLNVALCTRRPALHPSAPATTGNRLFAECEMVCRVQFFRHSAKKFFVECKKNTNLGRICSLGYLFDYLFCVLQRFFSCGGCITYAFRFVSLFDVPCPLLQVSAPFCFMHVEARVE
jgi:hypothetical protein